MKKKHLENILLIAIFIIVSLFIYLVILRRSIKDINWGVYLFMFGVYMITNYTMNKNRK
ncbi:MAG: hypothetical protein GX321_09160 [Clostridiales bacterium]|nr:hypothetical protein [Clostridiales bacterium]